MRPFRTVGPRRGVPRKAWMDDSFHGPGEEGDAPTPAVEGGDRPEPERPPPPEQWAAFVKEVREGLARLSSASSSRSTPMSSPMPSPSHRSRIPRPISSPPKSNSPPPLAPTIPRTNPSPPSKPQSTPNTPSSHSSLLTPTSPPSSAPSPRFHFPTFRASRPSPRGKEEWPPLQRSAVTGARDATLRPAAPRPGVVSSSPKPPPLPAPTPLPVARPAIPPLMSLNIPCPPSLYPRTIFRSHTPSTIPTPGNHPSQAQGSPSTVWCWNCHTRGHRHGECPFPRSMDFCHGCGKEGRKLATCPECRVLWRESRG